MSRSSRRFILEDSDGDNREPEAAKINSLVCLIQQGGPEQPCVSGQSRPLGNDYGDQHLQIQPELGGLVAQSAEKRALIKDRNTAEATVEPLASGLPGDVHSEAKLCDVSERHQPAGASVQNTRALPDSISRGISQAPRSRSPMCVHHELPTHTTSLPFHTASGAAHGTMHESGSDDILLLQRCKRPRVGEPNASPDYNAGDGVSGQPVEPPHGTSPPAASEPAITAGVPAGATAVDPPATKSGDGKDPPTALPGYLGAAEAKMKAESGHPLLLSIASPRRNQQQYNCSHSSPQRGGGCTDLCDAVCGGASHEHGHTASSDDDDDVVLRRRIGSHDSKPLQAKASAEATEAHAVTKPMPTLKPTDNGGSNGAGGTERYTLRTRCGRAEAAPQDVVSHGVAVAHGRARADFNSAGSCKSLRGVSKRFRDEEQEEEATLAPRRSARQQAVRRKQGLDQRLLGDPGGQRWGVQSARDSDSEYCIEKEKEEEEFKRNVRPASNRTTRQRLPKRGSKTHCGYDSSDDDNRSSALEDGSDSDKELDVPLMRRHGRNAALRTVPSRGFPPAPWTLRQGQRQMQKTSHVGEAAGCGRTQRAKRQHFHLDSDSKEEERAGKADPGAVAGIALAAADTAGEAADEDAYGRRAEGGRKLSGRLCRAAKATTAVELDEDAPQGALEDEDVDMRNLLLEPKTNRARSEASGRLSTATAAGSRRDNGGIWQRSRRPVQERKKLTVSEMRERARQKLEGVSGGGAGTCGASLGEEEKELRGDLAGGDRRRHRLQHPGLHEDWDAEVAAHAMFAADEALLLEDDVGHRGGLNQQRQVADEDDESDSFICDGDTEVDDASGEEEEEEDGATPQKPKAGGAMAAGFSGMGSPPVTGRVNTDDSENFKSWVTPMLCNLLHLRLQDNDRHALEQEQLDQKARAERFENKLKSARERTVSYSWVHAITKLGLRRALERYPTLMIDGMSTAQFYGAAGTRAVQVQIAREADQPGGSQAFMALSLHQRRKSYAAGDYDIDELEEDLPPCDICHAHRTHRLHVLSMLDDPADGSAVAATTISATVAAAGVADGKEDGREAREFLAGGMCCDRIVLFHALFHYKRWLLASLKKHLKYMLRDHLLQIGPGKMLSEQVRADALVAMFRNPKYLNFMYDRLKELLEAEEKLYMSENGRKDVRFMPGRLVAEVMSEVHHSINGYESDIPGIPTREEEEEEEEEEDEDQSGDGPDGYDGGTIGGESDHGMDDDDYRGGGQGGTRGGGRDLKTRRQSRRRLSVEDEEEREDASDRDASGGGTIAAATSGASDRTAFVSSVRDATLRRRTEAAAAARARADAANAEALAAAEAAGHASAAAAAVAAGGNLCLASPSLGPFRSHVNSSGGRRQRTITELLTPRSGSQHKKQRSPETPQERGADGYRPLPATANGCVPVLATASDQAHRPADVVELLDNSSDEAEAQAQAQATDAAPNKADTGYKGMAEIPAAVGPPEAALESMTIDVTGGCTSLSPEGQVRDTLYAEAALLEPVQNAATTVGRALALAQQVSAAGAAAAVKAAPAAPSLESSTQVQPVQGIDTQPYPDGNVLNGPGGANLAHVLNMASTAAVARMAGQRHPQHQ